MSSVDPKWAERIRAGDRRVLVSQFQHEARELRRLMLEHPQGFHLPWRDFRNFLADVGPSPGPAYRIINRVAGASAYRPETAGWGMAAEELPCAAPPSDVSQWTMISGMEPAALPTSTSLAQALGGGSTGAAPTPATGSPTLARDEAAVAETTDLSWFSPMQAHQEVFRQAYLAWRFRVQPKYRSAATAKFLYLYTLIPAMARSKATLEAAGLWKPLTKTAQEKRDDHPAWKRFNELLPKATVTIAGFDIYRQYSLTEDIDELSERVQTAELRFRTGSTTAKVA